MARGDLAFNAWPFVMHAKIRLHFILTLWTYKVIFFIKEKKLRKIIWKCCRITRETEKIKGFHTNHSPRGSIWCLNAESFKFYPGIVDICSHVHDIYFFSFLKSCGSECTYNSIVWNKVMEGWKRKSSFHDQRMVAGNRSNKEVWTVAERAGASEKLLSIPWKHPPGMARKGAGNKEDSE